MANNNKLPKIKKKYSISVLVPTYNEQDSLEGTIKAVLASDYKNIVEIIDPSERTRRYCLCRNPKSAAKDSNTRRDLLKKTRTELDKIAASKRKNDSEKIGARVGNSSSAGARWLLYHYI